eukprot:m.45998 g.45998  ORF g.45998 m.45998 type:complete len:740 (+) comp33655_c0_seq3:156-2375(+)
MKIPNLFLLLFVIGNAEGIFTAEPSDFFVPVGGNVTLPCLAENAGITWKSDRLSTEKSGSSLAIQRFNQSWEGIYYCVANMGSDLKIRSRNAKVTIRKFTYGPLLGQWSGSFHPSETVAVWFTMTGMADQLDIQWELECTVFTIPCRVGTDSCQLWSYKSQLDEITAYAVLRIRRNQSSFVQKCESYPISVVAIIEGVRKTSPSIAFRPSDPPSELYPGQQLVPQDTSVESGKTATLYCMANEVDVYDYVWSREGNPLPLSDTTGKWKLLQDGILQINAVTQTDSGVYTCSISQTNGKTWRQATAKLLVYEKPNVQATFSSHSVTCTVTGTKPFSVAVLLNAEEKKLSPVSVEETNTVVFDFKSGTTGIVQCLVDGKYGSSQDLFEIVQSDPKSPTTKPISFSDETQTPIENELEDEKKEVEKEEEEMQEDQDQMASSSMPSTSIDAKTLHSDIKITIAIAVGSTIAVLLLILLVITAIVYTVRKSRGEYKVGMDTVKENPYTTEDKKKAFSQSMGQSVRRSQLKETDQPEPGYASFKPSDDPLDDPLYSGVDIRPVAESEMSKADANGYAVVSELVQKKSPGKIEKMKSPPPIPSPYNGRNSEKRSEVGGASSDTSAPCNSGKPAPKNDATKLGHYLVGENEYAVSTKHRSRSATPLPSNDQLQTPDHSSVGKSEYAVLNKQREPSPAPYTLSSKKPEQTHPQSVPSIHTEQDTEKTSSENDAASTQEPVYSEIGADF